MLFWWGELVRVRSRAIAVVDYFARSLSNKQSVNSGFIKRFVDPILPVFFCHPTTHLVFGFEYAVIRDDVRKDERKRKSGRISDTRRGLNPKRRIENMFVFFFIAKKGGSPRASNSQLVIRKFGGGTLGATTTMPCMLDRLLQFFTYEYALEISKTNFGEKLDLAAAVTTRNQERPRPSLAESGGAGKVRHVQETARREVDLSSTLSRRRLKTWSKSDPFCCSRAASE